MENPDNMCRGCGEPFTGMDPSLFEVDRLCGHCAQAVELHAYERGVRFEIPSGIRGAAEVYRSPKWLVAVDAWLEAGGAPPRGHADVFVTKEVADGVR